MSTLIINVYANFYQNIQKVSKDSASFTVFSEFETRQRLGQSQMTFDNLLHYILSITMCMQTFIPILFHSVEEIGPFSHFQNLELGKASTGDKCHFAISWARSCQYQCVCKSVSKYELSTFFVYLFICLGGHLQNLNLGKC